MSELEDLKALAKIALELEEIDCGDNSCVFKAKKTGMRTNGGCRCLPYPEVKPELRRIVHRLALAVRKLPPEVRASVNGAGQG